MLYIGKLLLSCISLAPKYLVPFSQDFCVLISHHSSHLEKVILCPSASAGLWLLPSPSNPARKTVLLMSPPVPHT